MVANPRNPADPADGVNRHNFNSSSTQQTFALVYVNRSLGGDCRIGGTATLGMAGSNLNDGTAMRLDGTQISECAQIIQYPANVLHARVTAHETGHTFGLGHPIRSAPYVDAPPLVLPPDTYTRAIDVNTIYVWYGEYLYLGNIYRSEVVVDGVFDLVNNRADREDILAQWAYFRPGGYDAAIYQIDLRNPVDTQANRILVQIQERYIMDWTGRFTLQALTDWHFNPTMLPRMCVKSTCP